MTGTPAADYDSPWKDALSAYFRDFMLLLRPTLAACIDWTQPWRFLDKELQKRLRDDEAGRSYVDKLVEVVTYRHGTRRVLIHVEIQGRADARFPARMYRYNMLLKDVRGGPIVDSLAVLTGHRTSPEFMRYRDEGLVCITEFTFPVVALGQWHSRMPELASLAATNPFDVIVMAQLQALHDTDAERRLDGKIQLMRSLARSGYPRDDIQALLRLIDWMITLPPALEARFEQAGHELEQEMNMPFVTTFERLATERALKQGREEGLEAGIRQEMARASERERQAVRKIVQRQLIQRFNSLPQWANERLADATLDDLTEWTERIVHASTLDAILAPSAPTEN